MGFERLSKDELVKELTTRERRIEALVSQLHRHSFADGYAPPTDAPEHPPGLLPDELPDADGDARSSKAIENPEYASHPSFLADGVFTSLAEQSPNMIFVNCAGRVIFANDLVTETMGYSNLEIYDEDFDFLDLIAAESREAVLRNLEAHARGEDVPPCQYTLVTKSGTKIEAIINTKLVALDGKRAILGIVTDISDRIAVERALQVSAKRFETLVNTSLEAITETDLQGRITFASKNTVELHGYDREDELLGSNSLDLIAPEDQARALDNLKRTAESGCVKNETYTLLRRDGSRFYGELNATLIREPDGEPVGFLASIRDITRRVMLEEELRQAEKMRVLGQLAGGIAHDFNNQLTGIMGFAQLLFDRTSDDKMRDYAIRILNISEQAARLTQQLLAFARKGEQLRETVDLHEVIREITTILKHTVDRRVEFVTELNATPSTVRGDRSQIQNLVLNVAINACDAMPEGGTLSFETGLIQLTAPDEGTRPDLPAGEYLQIRFHDTGVGMDQATLARIFEPFFTTKDIGQGCGMGLPAAFGTVRSHHGSIDVTSHPGHGTTVQILLPSFAAESVKRVVQEEPTKTLGNAHVLVIDDEPAVLTSLEDALRRAGCRVSTHSDPHQAISFFEQSSATIDFVVLDLVMPGIHGRDVFAALKAIDPNVKCLLISGHVMDDSVDQAMRIGAQSFMQKPFNPNDLIRTIRDLI